MTKIGEVIRGLRGRDSLREASRKIGISHTYLDTVEKGYDKRTGKEVNPSPDTLKLIAEAYNYPYKKLLALAGYIQEVEEEEFQKFANDPELQQWYYKQLPQSDEEKLHQLRRMWEIMQEDKK